MRTAPEPIRAIYRKTKEWAADKKNEAKMTKAVTYDGGLEHMHEELEWISEQGNAFFDFYIELHTKFGDKQ